MAAGTAISLYKNIAIHDGICHLAISENNFIGHIISGSDLYGVWGTKSAKYPELHPCCFPYQTKRQCPELNKAEQCGNVTENEQFKFWDVRLFYYSTKETFYFKQILQQDPLNDMIVLTMDYQHLIEIHSKKNQSLHKQENSTEEVKSKSDLQENQRTFGISEKSLNILPNSPLLLSYETTEEFQFEFMTESIKIDEQAIAHFEKYFSNPNPISNPESNLHPALSKENLFCEPPLICIGKITIVSRMCLTSTT